MALVGTFVFFFLSQLRITYSFGYPKILKILLGGCVQEKVSPRFGGDRLGETLLNNLGERGGWVHDNASCPIIKSIAIRSCGNLDQMTEPKYSISAGYLADP